MYANESVNTLKKINLPQYTKQQKLTFILLLCVILSLWLIEYNNNKSEESQSLSIILKPKVNDIYFLDFRLLSHKLRPHEKYRIAKVADITGDTVTLVYGRFYYQYQNAAINSIRYSQLSYKDYFEPKRYNLPHSTIKDMYHGQAIYLALRPTRNKLFGSLVGPEKVKEASGLFIYGKNENNKGESFLNEVYSETNLTSAFELFQASSKLGYAKGQVNLAKMYINGWHAEKDLNKALYWLKQASLQSYKPAILKYGIICKNIPSCNVIDFYQELNSAGVNIKVREVDFKLGN
jgi:hypothetical protein